LTSTSREFCTELPPSCLKCKNRRAVTSSTWPLFSGSRCSPPAEGFYCATKSAVRALTEGLRMKLHSENIRCTIISPGAVESELKNGTSDPSSAAFVKDLYKKIAIPANSVARAVLYAIEQPADVEIDEVVLRPTAQDF